MILDRLVEHAYKRTRQAKQKVTLKEIKQQALMLPKGDFSFEKALKTSELAFICECKKASPSKGTISFDFPYLEIAKKYEAAGASCISVLTEPKWFLGSNEYLKEISKAVSLPCLRKDFIIDEYMIYEAKILGASAILLICSILSEQQIKKYIGICNQLGMSALVEVHNEAQIQMALNCNARIIGVNNRNLKDFTVDLNNSIKLRKLVPDDILFVAESGIATVEDIEKLQKVGVDAVLIGETLMKAENIKMSLAKLKGII